MKKLLFCIGAAWLPVVASAQSAVTSVTYFPTPYVAYNKLNVQNSLSVGLTSGSTEMILGHTQLSSNTPLTTPQTSLKRGKLALDLIADTGFLLDNQNDAPIQLGNGNNGEAVLRFNSNLRVPTVKDALSFHTAKLTTDHIRMFEPRDITNFKNDRHFPSCLEAIKKSDSSYTGNKGYITWENLVLGPCSNPNNEPSSTDCVKKAYLVCSGDTCGPNTNADTQQPCDIPDLQEMLKGEDGQPSVRPDNWAPGTFLSYSSADGTTRLYRLRTGAAACGYKTRAYRCDPATHNWVPVNEDTINRNACFAYMPQESETKSCSDSEVGLPALVPPENGSAVYEGTATRTKTYTCDSDGTVTGPSYSDWDTSNCKRIYYSWTRLSDSEVAAIYRPIYTTNPFVVWDTLYNKACWHATGGRESSIWGADVGCNHCKHETECADMTSFGQCKASLVGQYGLQTEEQRRYTATCQETAATFIVPWITEQVSVYRCYATMYRCDRLEYPVQ